MPRPPTNEVAWAVHLPDDVERIAVISRIDGARHCSAIHNDSHPLQTAVDLARLQLH